jgi:phage gp36-like protein
VPAYAIIDDVRFAIGDDTLRAIADHNGDHVIDDAVVLRALEEASALADTYLDDELPVPSPTPPALRRAVVDIAVNYLRSARDAGTDDSRLAYQGAISWLKSISDGKATLSPTPASTAGVVDAGDPEAVGRGRLWTDARARRVF